jgi:hypothetical protein
MSDFEPLSAPRFRVESTGACERIVIPAGRNWFVLLFLPFWLVMWTAGGVAAMADAANGQYTAFLLVWLVFWTIGWLFAASWFGWQLAGKELLSVDNGALTRGWAIFGFRRTKRYDLAHVEDLTTTTPPFPYGMMRVSYPPFFPMRFGPLKWNYGAATIYAASGLTEAEANMIAERLRARFPARLRG